MDNTKRRAVDRYKPAHAPVGGDLPQTVRWVATELERVGYAITGASEGTGTGDVPSTRTITGVQSVAGGGDLSADRTLALVNDQDTPPANYVYGTDGSGVRGWWPAGTGPGGGVTSIDVSGGITGLVFTGGPVTTAGTITMSGTLDAGHGGTGSDTLTGYIKGDGSAALYGQAGVPAEDISTPIDCGTFN